MKIRRGTFEKKKEKRKEKKEKKNENENKRKGIKSGGSLRENLKRR